MAMLLVLQAASQGVDSWGTSRDGPVANYQDSIKAGYLTTDAKGVDSRLEAGSEAYDEQQQMDQINKLLQEEQVCTGSSMCMCLSMVSKMHLYMMPSCHCRILSLLITVAVPVSNASLLYCYRCRRSSMILSYHRQLISMSTSAFRPWSTMNASTLREQLWDDSPY